MTQTYRTLRVAESDEGVLSVAIDAPPMNLIGPELVRDLVRLLRELESGQTPGHGAGERRPGVLRAARRSDQGRGVHRRGGQGGRAGRRVVGHVVAQAQRPASRDDRQAPRPGPRRGQRTGAGLRHAIRRAGERHPGTARGRRRRDPGRGWMQHLGRLLGRGRAMEAILGADDFDAEQAERYGWINRALPDAELDAFVARLARRIASFPAEAVRSTKQVLNELTLPAADAIRADARRFHQLVARTRPRPHGRTCSRRACRPAARSNSTSATASDPCDKHGSRSSDIIVPDRPGDVRSCHRIPPVPVDPVAVVSAYEAEKENWLRDLARGPGRPRPGPAARRPGRRRRRRGHVGLPPQAAPRRRGVLARRRRRPAAMPSCG